MENIINQSLIKNSLDKLIYIYRNENTLKLNQESETENNQQKHPNKSLKIKNFKNKESLNKKSIKLAEKSFLKSNFCNEECYKKFTEIIRKINSGEVNLNKINWNHINQLEDNRNDNFSNNFIQNLVNYYYSLGYNQALNELGHIKP